MSALQPSATILVKLGSIAVHAEEYLYSPGSHAFDKIALDQLLQDPEILEWLKEIGKLALLPVKR